MVTTVKIYEMTDKWTNINTNYAAISMNITNLASGISSKLLDLQIGAVSKFYIDKSGNLVLSGTVDGRDIALDGVKLDGIAPFATANQTDAEIKIAYENNLNTNAYTDAAQAKVGNITITQPVNLDTIESRVNILNAAVVLKGGWDASAGTFPVSTMIGESWVVTIGGIVNGITFNINDRVVSLATNASTTVYVNNWLKLDYTDQVLSVAGRTGAVTLASADIADFATATALTASVSANTAKLTTNTSNVTLAGALMNSQLTNIVAIKAINQGLATTDSPTFGPIFITEQAAASLDVAGNGQVWIKNTTPNELWFTDDTGVDTQLGGGGGASVTVATIPPLLPTAGDLYWNQTIGRLFIYYTDTTSSQWVDASPAGASTQTGAQILTAIKTVDGTLSGLDADLLDGKHSTDFASSQDTSLLYLYTAENKGGRLNMIGGIMDPFTNQTDVDTVASTGEGYHWGLYRRLGIGGAGIIREMNANTSVGQVASASSHDYGHEEWTAFYPYTPNGWRTSLGTLTGWLKIDLGYAPLVSGYRLEPSSASIMNPPKNWTFEGSANGTTWTVLDTQTNITGWAVYTSKSFTLAASASYRYYRINITLNNGDVNHTAIGEMQILAAVSTVDMSLQSNAFTAASTPTTARLGVQTAGALTINTDVIGYTSRDGGTTWSTATLVLVDTLADGSAYYEDSAVSVAAQPVGTAMKYKIVYTNSTAAILSGVLLQWS